MRSVKDEQKLLLRVML